LFDFPSTGLAGPEISNCLTPATVSIVAATLAASAPQSSSAARAPAAANSTPDIAR
jgi:hypothetical protein